MERFFQEFSIYITGIVWRSGSVKYAFATPASQCGSGGFQGPQRRERVHSIVIQPSRCLIKRRSSRDCMHPAPNQSINESVGQSAQQSAHQ
jgi:hypothetical protein